MVATHIKKIKHSIYMLCVSDVYLKTQLTRFFFLGRGGGGILHLNAGRLSVCSSCSFFFTSIPRKGQVVQKRGVKSTEKTE